MVAATGGPLENHLDKSLAVRWWFHRWATGGPPEACYQGNRLTAEAETEVQRRIENKQGKVNKVCTKYAYTGMIIW